jgi:thiol:disulfide interchange protein DsbD
VHQLQGDRARSAQRRGANKLAGFKLLRFDITESNAEQRALLDRYQLFGPPALMFLRRTAAKLPLIG